MIFKKFSFKRIKSTNDKSIQLIKAGNKLGCVTSDYQSNGRGKYGKKWISLKGNLFMSLFFEIKSQKGIKEISKLNLSILKKTLQKFSSQKITIKYPNDILIKKKKICGILQEIVHNKNRKYIIIGIGVNIVNSPKITNYSTDFLNNYRKKKINKFTVSKYIKKAYERNKINI